MKPTFQSDPLNSTYRWEIYLTQGLPQNRVPLLDGYSKGLGFERTNKLELLLAKLTNPILPYLDRSDRIVIYEQLPGMKKDYHPELITLFHRHYQLHNWVAQNFVISDFLRKYYHYRQQGTVPPAEDRRANRRVAKTDYVAELSHLAYTFQSHEELVEFCKKNIEKFSRACMVAWYHKHAMFQPELFEASSTTPAADVSQPVVSAEAVAGQSAINALHAKFQTTRR